MTFGREDYQETLVKKKHEYNVELLPMARILAGAAPIMERMTQSEDWNRYLTYLQGFLERLTLQVDIATNKLADNSVWKHEDLLKLKSDILIGRAGIEWLNLCIELPKAIMEGTEAAQKIINDFESKNETARKIDT